MEISQTSVFLFISNRSDANKFCDESVIRITKLTAEKS